MSYKLSVIGTSQTGKSTVLKHLAATRHEAGFLYLDPTGSHTDDLLGVLPPDRVVLFDPTLKNPTPLNPLFNIAPADRSTVVERTLSLFKDLAKYGDFSTGVFDRFIRNATACILETPDPSFITFKYLFLRDEHREQLLQHVTDPFIHAYWSEEFPEYDDRTRLDRIQSTLNQLDPIINDPRLRNTFCYPQTTVPTGPGTIFLARLPIDKLGPLTVRRIGLILLSTLQLPVIIDDAHYFTGETLTSILQSPRDSMIAVPSLDQLDNATQTALLSQPQKLVLRAGGHDADYFNRLLHIPPQATHPADLEAFQAYYSEPGERPRQPIHLPPFIPQPRRFKRRYTKNRTHVEKLLKRQLAQCLSSSSRS